MNIDIYARNPADPNYVDNLLELEDSLNLFKQQIESVLFSQKTAVMGTQDFGCSLDEYIWTFVTSGDDIKQEIARQVDQFCSMARNFSYSVDVNFYRGNIRDIAEIQIEINGTDRFAVLMG